MQSGFASGAGAPLARRAASATLIGLLRGYKILISPVLPSACRFYPTCSEYMREAITVHGPARGVWLGLMRLGRCHPFHAGGTDPVPAKSAR
jgi:putative membrane protein insertion efficiency factor